MKKKTEDKPDLNTWSESAIAKDFKPTIQIAEKRIKELEGHADLEKKLNNLKEAVIDGDKSLAKTLDEEINDLIFELGD